jgi:hypothetical protein
MRGLKFMKSILTVKHDPVTFRDVNCQTAAVALSVIHLSLYLQYLGFFRHDYPSNGKGSEK